MNSIKIIPFYKIVSVALLNLHSRSKANPYVYKKYSKEENNENKLTVQEMILTLQKFWSSNGCMLMQAYDTEKEPVP